jgi:hypothetical protein
VVHHDPPRARQLRIPRISIAAEEAEMDGSLKALAQPANWPALPPLSAWRDTYATLHLWMQMAGKVCLAHTPLTNHFWNIAFHLTPRGLATPPMAHGGHTFSMTFDFVDHQLVVQCDDGRVERIPLEPRPVADFYALLLETLGRLGLGVRIWAMPVEIPDPVRFDLDTVHRAYDPAAAGDFWRVLLAIKPAFDVFRAGFVGKCSPLHFFWGGFDLALTRFSGRRAPERPGADAVTRESYSHEVISHGFWPGSGPVQEAAFYAYAAPEPDGFKQAVVEPAAAYYCHDLGEFVLPYDAVRTAASPADDLLAFFRSTYDPAATLAGWNRSALERSG